MPTTIEKSLFARLALAVLLPALPATAQDLLVRCRTLVVAPDTVLTPGEFLVRDGKVAFVGRETPAETRARAQAVAFADATIVPGLVLAHTTLGRDADLGEGAVALTPDLLAADAFDPFLDRLQALPQYAVTSCMLAPASTNVAGGIAALVQPGKDMGRVARDRGYAQFSLAQAARNPERMPTSLMGAVDLLRAALLAAKTGAVPADGPGPGDLAALAAVTGGERRAYVHAETRAEILATLALARDLGFEPVLLGASEACDVVDQIAAAHCGVALHALQPAMREAQLRLPAVLESRGVPFCFTGDPVALRAAAALAVRHGASRRAALGAITRAAAELAGVGDTHGSLRRGSAADFAVWDGDPLDLGSRLLAVYVGGVRLVGDAPRATKAAVDLAAKEDL